MVAFNLDDIFHIVFIVTDMYATKNKKIGAPVLYPHPTGPQILTFLFLVVDLSVAMKKMWNTSSEFDATIRFFF